MSQNSARILRWQQYIAGWRANRRVVMTGEFVAVRGRLQRAGLVIHVVAESFMDLSQELRRLHQEGGDETDLPALVKSRDFH